MSKRINENENYTKYNLSYHVENLCNLTTNHNDSPSREGCDIFIYTRLIKDKKPDIPNKLNSLYPGKTAVIHILLMNDKIKTIIIELCPC